MDVGLFSRHTTLTDDELLRPSTRRAIEELEELIKQVKTAYAPVEANLDLLLSRSEETDAHD